MKSTKASTSIKPEDYTTLDLNSSWMVSEIQPTSFLNSKLTIEELIPPSGDYGLLYSPVSRPVNTSSIRSQTVLEDSTVDIASLIDHVQSVCEVKEDDDLVEFLEKVKAVVDDQELEQESQDMSTHRPVLNYHNIPTSPKDYSRGKTSYDSMKVKEPSQRPKRDDVDVSDRIESRWQTRQVYHLPRLEYKTMISEGETINEKTIDSITKKYIPAMNLRQEYNNDPLDETKLSMYNEGLSLASIEYLKRHRLMNSKPDESQFLDLDKINRLPKLR